MSSSTTISSQANCIFESKDYESNLYSCVVKDVSPTITLTDYALSSVTIGDTIPYTVKIENPDGVDILTPLFIDIFPSGIEYKSNTLYINYEKYEGTPDFSQGIPLDSIAPGDEVIIYFEVNVVNTPNNSTIDTVAQLSFTYKLASSEPTFEDNVFSNQSSISGVFPVVTLSGETDATDVFTGEEFDFSATLINDGTLDISSIIYKQLGTPSSSTTASASLINFVPPIDTFDDVETTLRYVEGTLVVNGIHIDGNPLEGVDLTFLFPDGIPPGTTITISYKLEVVTLSPSDPVTIIPDALYSYVNPSKPEETLTSTASSDPIIIPELLLSIELSSSTVSTKPGGNADYNLLITNISSTNLYELVLTSFVPLNTTLVDDSFTVDDVPIPVIDIDTGVMLTPSTEPLAPESSLIVSYSVTLDENYSLNALVNVVNLLFDIVDSSNNQALNTQISSSYEYNPTLGKYTKTLHTTTNDYSIPVILRPRPKPSSGIYAYVVWSFPQPSTYVNGQVSSKIQNNSNNL